jgi:hypothetical protein
VVVARPGPETTSVRLDTESWALAARRQTAIVDELFFPKRNRFHRIEGVGTSVNTDRRIGH